MVKSAELMTHVIPENFVNTGRCFNGMFRTRNLVEGAIFSAPAAYIIYNMEFSDINRQLTWFIMVVGLIMGFFIVGINGDSVLEFAFHFFSFKKMKRVSKYNPRVKTEATPEFLTGENSDLPINKIKKFINEIRERQSGNVGEGVSSNIYDPVYIEFFQDDVGILETPDDLKSSREKRKQQRALKKEEKRKQKELKKMLRAYEKNKKRKKGDVGE